MSKADRLLAEQRAARDRARSEFNRRLAQAKIDLAPAVLKRRVVAEVRQASLSAAQQAIDIASDNRGVVAATVAALLLWLTRKPAMTGANALLERLTRRRARWSTPTDKLKLLVADYWRKLKDYADE